MGIVFIPVGNAQDDQRSDVIEAGGFNLAPGHGDVLADAEIDGFRIEHDANPVQAPEVSGVGFRVEHDTNPVQAPETEGQLPGTGISRSDAMAEDTSSGLKIEHTLTQQADAIVMNWDDLEKVSSDGLLPSVGGTGGDIRCDDAHSCAVEADETSGIGSDPGSQNAAESFDFAPADPARGQGTQLMADLFTEPHDVVAPLTEGPAEQVLEPLDASADGGGTRDWPDIDDTGFHDLFDQGLDIWDWYTNPLG